jgi:uncharacterized protein YjbI with pentapeptide repeats
MEDYARRGLIDDRTFDFVRCERRDWSLLGLPGAGLGWAVFSEARMREADLTGARCEEAKLRRVDLPGAWLHKAKSGGFGGGRGLWGTRAKLPPLKAR